MPGSRLPLRSLVVFEAAARHGSFKGAAEELRLTPSAISHQIRMMEARLGTHLFERAGRGVSLSPEGRDFFAGVHDGFVILSRAIDTVSRRRNRQTELVRVQTPPSLAGRWLLPRLPELLARHPHLDIRVNADHGHRTGTAGIDLAVVYGDAKAWSRQAKPLIDEVVQPLCAPDLAARVKVPSDLLSLPLIATRGNVVSWAMWFRRHGIDFGRRGAPAMELDPSHVAIDAATKGLGIVLESDVITGSEVADGRLVAPLAGHAVEATSYWLLPVAEETRPVVDLVRAWLVAAAGR